MTGGPINYWKRERISPLCCWTSSERRGARHLFRAKPLGDGAAPLIGSSRAIKTLRERIERVARPTSPY